MTLTTSDGLELEGWYIPSKNRAAVIVFPGRAAPRSTPGCSPPHGYGVLLFDRRGEGASEGEGNMFGWGGERDIFAAHRLPRGPARRRPGADRRARPLRRRRADAAGGRRGRAARRRGLRGRRHPDHQRRGEGRPRSREMWLVLPADRPSRRPSSAMFSNTMPPPRLRELVPEIAPRPDDVHLGAQRRQRRDREPRLPPARRCRAPRSGRSRTPPTSAGITAHPEEYDRRVTGFFDDALLADR